MTGMANPATRRHTPKDLNSNATCIFKNGEKRRVVVVWSLNLLLN